jgi:hypothetical protein
MNKKGMALAADSAITSGAEGVRKVYHSANKLFSLSKEHPVGIMIYGSASFMEVPWEIIIKSFRQQVDDRRFDDLTDYGTAFLEFISTDDRLKQKEIEQVIVDRTISDHLKLIVKEVEDKIEGYAGGPVDQEKVMTWLEEATEGEIEFYKQQENVLLDFDYQPFKRRFMPLISDIANELISYPVEKSLEQKLVELAYEATRKDYFSRGSSGLVISGYGEKEIFPHLINYRLEGFLFGQLKYKKLKERQISYSPGRYNGTACITAFAQTEMVESFMHGLEPDMKHAIYKIVENILFSYGEQIQNHTSIQLTNKQVTELQKLGKEMYASIEDAVKEYQQQDYINPLLDIVRALPKEELADMAESLINLTSFKRRVTRVHESVGLPADVAMITKGDGFVWVKRKEYVDPNINFHL